MADVSTRSKRFEELEGKIDLPRALMGGTAEMREEGTEFLPQHPAESDEAYAVRLQGTTLYNGFSDTVKKSTGKVFSSPIVINDDVPPQVATLLDNVDAAGRDLNSFAYDLFKEGMVDGISYIYVDFTKVQPTTEYENPTMADQMRLGARPYALIYCLENILGVRSETINGVQVPVEIRIEETVVESAAGNPYEEIEIEQVRVLRPGSYELHRKNKEDEWVLYEEGQTSLDYIPMIPVYVNRVGFFEGEPPLMPLAELNLEHWISSSEQRKALTFARFAMLSLSGVDAKSEVKVGPDKVLKLPQGADAKYVETSGSALEAGRADLEAIEKRMQHAGMTIRVSTANGVTATAAAIDSVEADAALAAAAKSLEDSLNNMLQVMAEYLQLPDGGTVSVDTKLGKATATGTPQEVVQLYATGLLTKKTALQELQRRGTISASVDIETEASAEEV